jgi:hypothetical protein
MKHRVNDLSDEVPQAHGVGVFFCDEPLCRRPHVMLFDSDSKPIAHFVVPDPRSDGTGFMSDLKNLMYRGAVERNDTD